MTVQTPARSVDAVIGKAIRKRRLVLGMSQNEIAKLWKRPESYVELVETGVLRPEAFELSTVGTLFHCRLSDFFGDAIKSSPA